MFGSCAFLFCGRFSVSGCRRRWPGGRVLADIRAALVIPFVNQARNCVSECMNRQNQISQEERTANLFNSVAVGTRVVRYICRSFISSCALVAGEGASAPRGAYLLTVNGGDE